MPTYKIMLPVEIGDRIYKVGETVDQSAMRPAEGDSPSEWDSLMGTGHIAAAE